MDESEFAIGSSLSACIIINAESCSQFQTQPGRQECVTVVEFICRDGTVINLLVIFRRTNFNTEWLVPKFYISNWRFSASCQG